MESRKRLTMNQLGFSSTMAINYDNLDILVVKPSKQENHCFQVPAKSSLWHHHCKEGSCKVTFGLFLDFTASTEIDDMISHPSLSNRNSWEAWTQLTWQVAATSLRGSAEGCQIPHFLSFRVPVIFKPPGCKTTMLLH